MWSFNYEQLQEEFSRKKKKVLRREEDKRDVHFEVGLNVSSNV